MIAIGGCWGPSGSTSTKRRAEPSTAPAKRVRQGRVPLQQQRAARARAIVLATLQDNVAAFGRWAARPIDRAAPLAASATPASQVRTRVPGRCVVFARHASVRRCAAATTGILFIIQGAPTPDR